MDPLDTRTLCLGALTEGDASGYEIRKLLLERFGHFLDVSFGSIYPALAALLQEGLVDCQEITQRGRPDKKRYRITDAGHDAFVASLLQSPGRHKTRSEFLALLCFAHFMPPEQVQWVLDERHSEFEAAMHEADRWLAESGDGTPAGMRFAAGFRRALMAAACDYIREHRVELKQR
ncbi:PadR family transcriptional regulator [Aquisalimonas sp. APHAB1-3]|uniref:PadR family transcriptional regulator n=1 Tax=Aquisalimonas sp. APHAB1-3 TaxID=3402080 RepID=UPI003AADB186